MRVVLDTNAAVRILRGHVGLLELKRLAGKHVQFFTSSYILSEIEKILYKKSEMTRQRAKVLSRSFGVVCKVYEPVEINAVCRDPKDDQVLAAAVGSEADYLVSNDKDLLEIGEYAGVKVINLEQFRKVVGV